MRKLKFEHRITAGYVIIGGFWIIFSDKILDLLIKDSDVLTRFQTYKGWFYVIITAMLFYSILNKHLIKIRNAEKKAIDSDKLKTAFLQNISHEIRTPMNSIIGFSELIKNNHLSESEKEEYLELISNSSNQLLDIVNEVLDISLIETGNLSVNKRKVHLNILLDDIHHMFKLLVKPNISFSVTKGLPDQSCTIFTDETKVRQILDNLINNAIKYTDKGHIIFGYTLKDTDLEFFVEDTGIGIDSDFHNKIFDRFRKVEEDSEKLFRGIGLGLAICHGNVELLKGKIWIESEPGNGSKFLFTIPYEPVIEEDTITKNKDDIKSLDGLTILVAEDDEINFMYIKEIFRNTGVELLHAANGKEAVEICRNNNNIVILLIDIKMPVMNGYEAIKQIREFRPNLPIIAQTAFALSNEMLKAFNAGSNDYISKPFKKEQLLALVSKYLISDQQ